MKGFKMDLNKFIGKNEKELEREYGFTHYLETKDSLILDIEQSHESIVNAFFEFIKDDGIKVIKTENGDVKEFFDMDMEDIKNNLLFLEEDKRRFYNDDCEISYGFLGKNFFAYIFSGIMMFSANQENVNKMARILDKYSLKYFEPYNIENE